METLILNILQLTVQFFHLIFRASRPPSELFHQRTKPAAGVQVEIAQSGVMKVKTQKLGAHGAEEVQRQRASVQLVPDGLKVPGDGVTAWMEEGGLVVMLHEAGPAA